jgi:hypothetical protein
MQALVIKPKEQRIEPVELQMQANTLYTYFSSILIDELIGLKNHIIYTDANALGNKEPAYFVGEQLVLGEAVIFGRNGMEDVDVSIPKEELASIVNYDIPLFYQQALALLAQSDINLYRTFLVSKNGENIALNAEWVLYTFNIADKRTREYFLNELQKVLESGASVEAYVQKMAQLAMNAAG